MSQKPRNVGPNKPDARAEPIAGTVEREQKRSSVVTTAFQGPLPPPSLLKEYDGVVPGLAEEIVQWTTSQTGHRQGIESRAMAIDEKLSTWYVVEILIGQLFALIIALSVIVAVVYLAVRDHEVAASALGTVGFGGIIAAFITGRRKRTPSEAGDPQADPKPAGKKK